MPRTKQKARRKGAKGGGSSSGKGEGEGAASASSSGAHAQPQAAASSASASFETPANTSHARDDGSSSSETERPSKKHKLEAAEPRDATKDLADDAGRTNDNAPQLPPSPLEDLTNIALEGKDASKDTSNVRSSFGFSPAKPPAANVAWGSPTHRPSTLPPRYALARSASAQQWKMSATQRHADSFKFFSRDVLSRWALPSLDIPVLDYDMDHSMRADFFDVTGSIIWLQAHAINDQSWMDTEHSAEASTFFESAGRSYGTQRFVGTTEEDQWDNEYDSNRRSEFPCAYSHLGFTPHLHPQLNCGELTDVRLHRFDRASSRPRGLAGTDFQLPSEDRWDHHDMPWVQTVLNASCSPQLLADAACYEILHPTKDEKGRKRPTELHLVLLFPFRSEDESYGRFLRQIHWAPSGKSIVKIPRPHQQDHSAVTISEGTAYCWLGYSDGRIELFDPSAYSFEVMAKGKSNDNIYSARGVIPDFREVLPASEARGRVLKLLAVGSTEVVAIFSKGTMLLLRATSSKSAEVVRDFVGLVLEERGSANSCIHAESRLLAVSGGDQKIRIWHLEDEYPLNSAWHRQRHRRAALDLHPEPHGDSEAKHLDAAASTSSAALNPSAQHTVAALAPGVSPATGTTSNWNFVGGAAPAASATSSGVAGLSAALPQPAAKPKPSGTSLEMLAMRSMTEAKAKNAAQKRLDELVWRNPCGMTFSPTSWAADRDTQWELTREFEGDDINGLKPKVISAGLLPSMVCGSSSLRGPMLIYFEPARRSGVEFGKKEEEVSPVKMGAKKKK